MADGLEISIDVTGDLSDLTTRLMEKATKAVDAGAKRLIDEHEEIVRDWGSEAKPDFTTTPIVSADDEVSIGIRADGQIWHWVNEGTAPKTITGRMMKFPWEAPDTSYNSSYDPKISKDWAMGSGTKHGGVIRTNTVRERWIRPRNIDKKAIERAKDEIIAILQSFFK